MGILTILQVLAPLFAAIVARWRGASWPRTALAGLGVWLVVFVALGLLDAAGFF